MKSYAICTNLKLPFATTLLGLRNEIQFEGDFYLDAGTEEKEAIKPGSIILAPKNVWHKVVNTGSGTLVVSQSTKQPAGMEKR